MRILFMGTPDFALPSLRALVAAEEVVVAVLTQPDRPRGRGLKVAPPPVKTLALELGIPVLQPEKLKSAEVRSRVEELTPDLIAVAAYGRFIPPAIFNLPPHGSINLHPSLLPRYRGAAPVNWAIINGDETTGVTVLEMTEEMDAGRILLQSEVPVGQDETTGELLERLAEVGAPLLCRAVRGIADGEIDPVAQGEAQVTLAPRLTKEDGLIDWRQPARRIHNRVRGLHPWPGAYTTLRGKRLTLHRTRLLEEHGGPQEHGGGGKPGIGRPGTVRALSPEGIEVHCGEGVLALVEVQLEGRRRLTAAQFITGTSLAPGDALGDG